MDYFKKIAALIVLLIAGAAYPQNNPQLLLIEKEIAAGKNAQALKMLDAFKPMSAMSGAESAYFTLLKANCYYNLGKNDLALKNYLVAKKAYLQCDSMHKAMDINLDIVYLKRAQTSNSSYYSYLIEYINHAQKEGNTTRLARGYGYMGMFKADEGKYNESLSYYQSALRLLKKNNKDSGLESAINNNLANLYNEKLAKPDSALIYLKRDHDLIKTDNNPADLYYNYVNQASSYYHKKDHKTAVKFLKMAEALNIADDVSKSRQILYEQLAKNFGLMKDFENAYKYQLQAKTTRDTLKAHELSIAVADIETKYQTKEKELENKILKSNIKTNHILLYTFSGLLIATIMIGYLVVKNARRRERIAEQDKLIGQQKFEKKLKDYELHSIDMMLEGQEKERERIANDLHDNLGSMLATLKLNFENLKRRQATTGDDENKLYDRTDELIEEAYQKVRRMAHAKNAGVLANKGLLPAIKKLAEKLNIPGKLSIQVIDFGFDSRLENALEITVFRMVQELATNIIKHSQATEATIHLTQHDDNINIIIEDNGVGFNPAGKINDDGMGLTSMTRKAEQMGGTFTIDSTPGKGTTIIIDIPI